MTTNIVRNEDGTVTFPADLMELVEHMSYLVMNDPKFRSFVEENAGERDQFAWTTLILGCVITQCS